MSLNTAYHATVQLQQATSSCCKGGGLEPRPSEHFTKSKHLEEQSHWCALAAGMNKISDQQLAQAEKQTKLWTSMINSMTAKEREAPEVSLHPSEATMHSSCSICMPSGQARPQLWSRCLVALHVVHMADACDSNILGCNYCQATL